MKKRKIIYKIGDALLFPFFGELYVHIITNIDRVNQLYTLEYLPGFGNGGCDMSFEKAHRENEFDFNDEDEKENWIKLCKECWDAKYPYQVDYAFICFCASEHQRLERKLSYLR